MNNTNKHQKILNNINKELSHDHDGMPYLVGIARKLPWRIDDSKIERAYTDGEGYVITTAMLDRPDAKFVVAHEYHHPIFRHIQRGRDILQRFPVLTFKDVNCIADALINELLAGVLRMKLPADAWTFTGVMNEYKVAIDLHDSLESACARVAAKLQQQPKQQEQQQNKQSDKQDKQSDEKQDNPSSGSGKGQGKPDKPDKQAKDKPADKTQSQDADKPEDAAKNEHGDDCPMSNQKLDELLQKAIYEQNKIDDKPDAKSRVIEEHHQQRDRVNWRDYLEGILRGAGEKTVRSYAFYNKRSLTTGVLEPTLQGSCPSKVLLAVDISGSMDEGLAAGSIEVCREFAELYPQLEIYVGTFNTSIEVLGRFDSDHYYWNNTVGSAGGTEFAPVNEMQQQVQADMVFILTDLGANVQDITKASMMGAKTFWLVYYTERCEKQFCQMSDQVLHGEVVNMMLR